MIPTEILNLVRIAIDYFVQMKDGENLVLIE